MTPTRRPAPFALLLLPLLVPSAAPADDAAIRRDVVAKVQVLHDATIAGDYGKVADLTHPRIVELAGGREKMVALMEKSIGEMKEQGVQFQSGKVGEAAGLVTQGDDLYTVVPFELTMKLPKAKITSYGYVIGVSGDRGKTWTFVNSSAKGALKKILPDLPEALHLPADRKPLIVDN